MNVARTLAVAVVALLLSTTLVTATVAAGAHLTVLDPEFVTETVEDEEGYVAIRDAARETIAEEAPASMGPVDVDTDAIIAEGVNRPYVKRQTEANVNRTYAYLHGAREDLSLSVDTRPLKQNASAAVASEVANASVATLVAESGVELREPVDQDLLEQMTSGPEGYRAAQDQVRSEVRERVLDAAVQRAFQQASNDRLLALVIEDYDPDDYTEEEKAQMVSEREDEIRSVLRERLQEERGDEIEDRVDQELDSIREEYAGQTAEDPVENASLAIQSTVVTGLTTDMDYETFRSQLDADKERLGEAVGQRAETQLDQEVPDRLDLTQQMGDGATQNLESARTTVQWFDRLAFVLPVLAALLIGLLYYVTRSVQTVLGTTGAAAVSAGFPVYLSLGVLQSRLGETLGQTVGRNDQLSGLAVGFVERVIAEFAAVSLTFVAAGVVLLAGWLALRFDLLERVLGEDGASGPIT